MNKRKYIYILSLLVIFVAVVAAAKFLTLYNQKMSNIEQAYNNKISDLQQQVSTLKDQMTADKKAASTPVPIPKAITPKSATPTPNTNTQQQSVTGTVSKVVPAVVSIAITENVPQYTIVYENPFGDNPFFKDFGVQIPVYKATGEMKAQQVGAGTGFIVNSNGYIVTNRHVVFDDKASYTVLLTNGKQQVAKIVYKDPNNDVAVIKIDGTGYPSVSLGDSNGLQLGQSVIAIGNALGEYNNSVSLGIISGLNRSIEASGVNGNVEKLNGVIQTDAAINPGNSGGPLVDLNGNVVGVNVATVQGSSNVSFSIPINIVKDIIKTKVGI